MGRQTLRGGLASQAADIGEEGVGAAVRACPGMAISPFPARKAPDTGPPPLPPQPLTL